MKAGEPESSNEPKVICSGQPEHMAALVGIPSSGSQVPNRTEGYSRVSAVALGNGLLLSTCASTGFPPAQSVD